MSPRGRRYGWTAANGTAEAFQIARVNQGLSMHDLANNVGVNLTTLMQFLKMRRQLPKWVNDIERMLQLPLEKWFEHIAIPPCNKPSKCLSSIRMERRTRKHLLDILCTGNDDQDLRRFCEQNLSKALANLSERVRCVITLRYGIDGGGGLAYKEIASRPGVTRARIGQMVQTGEKRLQWFLNREFCTQLLFHHTRPPEHHADIEALNLSVRVYNHLYRCGITTIAHLCEYSQAQVLRIKNLGFNALKEIQVKLDSLGLALKTEQHSGDKGLLEDEEYPEENRSRDAVTVEDLNLSSRAYNCLKGNGIRDIKDLRCRTLDELMKTPRLGVKMANEVVTKLEALGLSLRED